MRSPANSAAVTASASDLTELCGVGNLTAGKIARIGHITRFRCPATFASLHRHRPRQGVLP